MIFSCHYLLLDDCFSCFWSKLLEQSKVQAICWISRVKKWQFGTERGYHGHNDFVSFERLKVLLGIEVVSCGKQFLQLDKMDICLGKESNWPDVDWADLL
jgi:hypothetical protein